MNTTASAPSAAGDLQGLLESAVALCQSTPTNPPRPPAKEPGAPPRRALTDASSNRLACLLRHWTWANEAMTRFERELAEGWTQDGDPLADHPFGAYYHWCALLCGFSEAALEQGLLSPSQLERLRPDLEASVPALRACRQLLVEIPATLEEHPLVADLVHDEQTRSRLRRIHTAFGDALREEHLARELEWLLYEH